MAPLNKLGNPETTDLSPHVWLVLFSHIQNENSKSEQTFHLAYFEMYIWHLEGNNPGSQHYSYPLHFTFNSDLSQLLIFIVLAITSIANDNIVLTKLIAEISERSNIVKKKLYRARNTSSQTIIKNLNKPRLATLIWKKNQWFIFGWPQNEVVKGPHTLCCNSSHRGSLHLVLNFWHLQKSKSGCLWFPNLWIGRWWTCECYHGYDWWPKILPRLPWLSIFIQVTSKLYCIWVLR